MNLMYFTKLAWVGIKNNRRLYVPYILTCIGMVSMVYLVSYLQTSEVLVTGFGGGTIGVMMFFGKIVLTFFSVIFLFYTNSFLMKKRRKEFGLYNILGMNKRDIGKIMLLESIIVYSFAILFGVSLGIVFSRLGELLLMNIAHLDVSTVFRQLLVVSVPSILYCVIGFGVILFLILLNSLRGLLFHNPIQLLRSENYGEKPPKANWLLALIGLGILVGAYTIALWDHNPLIAMLYFFIAVIMVIIATYLLFITGSVVFCRLLQRNSKYYYKRNHFTSVASMVYRMKRNGAGLASICILCTMILVTLSSTVTLMNNVQVAANALAPADFVFDFSSNEQAEIESSLTDFVKDRFTAELFQKGIKVEQAYEFRFIQGIAKREDNSIYIANRIDDQEILIRERKLMSFVVIGLDDYNKATGMNLSLNEGEVALSGVDLKGDLLIHYLEHDHEQYNSIKSLHYRIVDDETKTLKSIQTMFEAIQLVVPDLNAFLNRNVEGYLISESGWCYHVNADAAPETLRGVGGDVVSAVRNSKKENMGGYQSFSYINRTEFIEESYSIFGGLFFLGLLLSIAFLFGTVLIIYYKQLSEGFEDQSRFDIMQKVGMSEKLIRKSINSQILTVFFATLIAAGIHLAFSLPITFGFLTLVFNVRNIWSVAWIYLICYSVFALVYVIIYKVTSNTYYKVAVKQTK